MRPDKRGVWSGAECALQLVREEPLLMDVHWRVEASGRLVGLDQRRMIGRHAVGRRSVETPGGTQLERRVAADHLTQSTHHATTQELLQSIRVHVGRVGMQGIGVCLGQERNHPTRELAAAVRSQLPGLAE
jgi:hypothetical protein